jgi:Flp pilus assembly protein TadD
MTVERGSWRRPALAAAALAALAFLPSLRGGFLYDDQHVVLDNRSIRSLGALGTILRYEPARPLLGLTWALNYAVAGPTPWPYHLVSLLVHAANAALVALLFLWMAERTDSPNPRRAAFLGACLFGVTPMAVETVAYVSSRSTALASLLVLSSLLLAVPALEGRSSRSRRAAAVAVFLLALATKEEAAALPLFLLLLDRFFVTGRSWRDAVARWRVHAPFVALPILGFLARRAATGQWLPPSQVAVGRYLATQVAAFPGYLVRALVPIDPAFYRGAPFASWPPDAATLAGWTGSAVVAVGAFWARRRWPLVTFAIAWLAAGLLPSSSIVPLKEAVVDHRAYLGGAGVLFAVGAALAGPGRGVVSAVLVALLTARSIHYQGVLADPARAWEDAVRRAPSAAEAHLGLGEAYAASHDPRAEESLRRAIALDPRSPRGWANLGALYAEAGRLDEAEQAMRNAAREAPWDARLHDNRGLLLQALGREDEAVAEFEAAILGQPPLAQPRIRLAAILIRRGDKARALAVLQDATRLELDEEDARAIEALWARLH